MMKFDRIFCTIIFKLKPTYLMNRHKIHTFAKIAAASIFPEFPVINVVWP
jgi:hypothetical protein